MTKSGDIAGPRVLEHIVDAVLYLEVGTSSFYGLPCCSQSLFISL